MLRLYSAATVSQPCARWCRRDLGCVELRIGPTVSEITVGSHAETSRVPHVESGVLRLTSAPMRLRSMSEANFARVPAPATAAFTGYRSVSPKSISSRRDVRSDVNGPTFFFTRSLLRFCQQTAVHPQTLHVQVLHFRKICTLMRCVLMRIKLCSQLNCLVSRRRRSVTSGNILAATFESPTMTAGPLRPS